MFFSFQKDKFGYICKFLKHKFTSISKKCKFKLGDFKENDNFITQVPTTDTLKTHSNLYDFEKIKRRLEANNAERFKQNCFMEFPGEELPDFIYFKCLPL